MSNEKQSHDELNRKKTILELFFTRSERDKDYIPDLTKQWSAMDTPQRIRFVFGAVVGLIIFIGALLLVYFILSKFIG